MLYIGYSYYWCYVDFSSIMCVWEVKYMPTHVHIRVCVCICIKCHSYFSCSYFVSYTLSYACACVCVLMFTCLCLCFACVCRNSFLHMRFELKSTLTSNMFYTNSQYKVQEPLKLQGYYVVLYGFLWVYAGKITRNSRPIFFPSKWVK